MRTQILISRCKERLEIADRLQDNAPTEFGKSIYREIFKNELKKFNELTNKLNNDQNAQASVATDDDSSNQADNIKKNNS